MATAIPEFFWASAQMHASPAGALNVEIACDVLYLDRFQTTFEAVREGINHCMVKWIMTKGLVTEADLKEDGWDHHDKAASKVATLKAMIKKRDRWSYGCNPAYFKLKNGLMVYLDENGEESEVFDGPAPELRITPTR